MLGPGGRGSTAFLLVAAQVVAAVASFGLPEATVVLAASVERRSRLLVNLLSFSAASSCVFGLATAVGLSLLGDLRPAAAGPSELAALAAAIVAYTLYSAGASFLLGCGRLVQRAILVATFPWLYAGLIGALAGILDVTLVVVTWGACQALGAVVCFAYSARRVGLARPNTSLLRSSLGIGIRLWIGTLASFLNFRADQVLMGFITTPSTLGVYAVAVNFSEPLLYLPTAVSNALTPLVAASAPADRLRPMQKALWFLVLTTAAGIVVAAIVGPPLIPILFGGAFNTSVQPFLWLVPGAIGYVLTRVYSSALMGASAAGLSSVGPVTALLVGIMLDLALIPSYGATGAAIAATGAFTAGGIGSILAFRGHRPITWRDALGLSRRR